MFNVVVVSTTEAKIYFKSITINTPPARTAVTVNPNSLIMLKISIETSSFICIYMKKGGIAAPLPQLELY